MSWSFNIEGGDLDFVSKKNGASIVTGRNKALQDIRAALLEPMGSDPMHPDYGSLLDGGRLPNGSIASPLIGQDRSHTFQIEEEISRILRYLMDKQEQRTKADIQNYGRSTLSASETIAGVKEISSRMFGTTLVVRVEVTMQDNNTVSITTPIS